MSKFERRVTWTWTNWTFGIWSSPKRYPCRAFGIDFGPFEVVWSWRHKQLHPRSTAGVR